MNRAAEPTDGEWSPLAKTFDLVRLDRFAGGRYELYDLVAIPHEDARYSDGGASVKCLGTKLSIAALVMHLPHRATQSRTGQSTH